MPFKSKAQQRFLFAKHPKIAKEFADETDDIKDLPEHVSDKKEDHKSDKKDPPKDPPKKKTREDRITDIMNQINAMVPEEAGESEPDKQLEKNEGELGIDLDKDKEENEPKSHLFRQKKNG